MSLKEFLKWKERRKFERRKKEAIEKLQSAKEMIEFMLSNKRLRRQKYLPTSLTIKSYEMILEKLK